MGIFVESRSEGVGLFLGLHNKSGGRRGRGDDLILAVDVRRNALFLYWWQKCHFKGKY